MTSKFCTHCGTKAPSLASKFCSSCGESLDSFEKKVAPQKTFIRARVVDDDPDGTDSMELPDLGAVKESLARANSIGSDGSFNTDFGVLGGNSFSFGKDNLVPAPFRRKTR